MLMETKPEELIRSSEIEWNAAIRRRDVTVMDRFLAATFRVVVGIEGQPLSITPREQWLETLKVYLLDFQAIDDMSISMYGDVAVVVLAYRQIGGTPGNRDISGNFLLTDIWVKTPDGWRVTERHSSRLEKLAARD
jgi:ketosteroid isomerase-like protein